jgi:hypothetical protein
MYRGPLRFFSLLLLSEKWPAEVRTGTTLRKADGPPLSYAALGACQVLLVGNSQDFNLVRMSLGSKKKPLKRCLPIDLEFIVLLPNASWPLFPINSAPPIFSAGW